MPRYPSEALRSARRSLEGVRGVELIGDWVCYERLKQWGLFLRLRHHGDESRVPSLTGWHVVAGDEYPFGAVSIFPDREAGIVETFPHQRANVLLPDDLPWRASNICASTQFQHFGRNALTEEPWTPATRIRWSVTRAIEWISAAANDTLVLPDDPFERPVFDSNGDRSWSFAYQEDTVTFQRWNQIAETSGIVELVQTASTGETLMVHRFLDPHSREVFRPRWERRHFDAATSRLRGVWIRTNSLPTLAPYAAPTIWRELKEVLRNNGIDLWHNLELLANKVRKEPHFILLLGYPIKEFNKDDWSSLQWQAAVGPPLSNGSHTLNGFRPGHNSGRWMLDRRTVLQNDKSINWQPTRSWSAESISSRGRFPSTLVDTKVLLVGAGALGSIIAEQLIRGGVKRLGVVDHDKLEAGNLVRHTLTLLDLGKSKSDSLAELE